MKVLLIKDVYKLGHAGDVKKVADGYGRNYLIPQGLAILATPGAMKQAESIRGRAAATRQVMNEELGGLAAQIEGKTLTFTSKAGETGKLYGSITTQIIAEELSKVVGAQVDRKLVESQPIRTLGEHKAKIHLTMDLTPEIKVIVLREGEALPTTAAPTTEKKAKKAVEETVEPVEEPAAEMTTESVEEPADEELIETPSGEEETPAEETAG
jgi:large subunit ribosomal protein L9